MAQLQHNMLVAGTKKSVLSIINGGASGSSCRPDLPDHPDRRRESLLAGGQDRRDAGSVRLRTAEATDRSGPGRGHERLELVPTRTTNEPKPNSRGYCPRAPRRRWATASAPSAPSPAPSASIWSRWRLPMHRSSESVAAIATALAKAQTELSNPKKAMLGTVYELPLRLAGEWPGHRQKGPGRPPGWPKG
jgi:hypothetical protein